MLLAFLCSRVLLLAALAGAQTCYNPDRTIASNAVPCSADNGTFCCDPSAICLSSGYCLSATSQPLTLYRGSCTDSGWGGFCAYYCVNYRTGNNAPIISLGLNDDGRAIYCCGYQEDNRNSTTTTCANGDAPFVLDDGAMIFGRAALADASTTSHNGTDSSSGPSVGTSSDGNSGSSDCSSSNSTAIGAGVGVPLGVLTLAAAAWALWERRRRRQQVVSVPLPAQATREVYMPPQRKSSPTELDQMADSSNPGTLIQGTALVEMMGSEGRRD